MNSSLVKDDMAAITAKQLIEALLNLPPDTKMGYLDCPLVDVAVKVGHGYCNMTGFETHTLSILTSPIAEQSLMRMAKIVPSPPALTECLHCDFGFCSTPCDRCPDKSEWYRYRDERIAGRLAKDFHAEPLKSEL